MKHLLSGAAAAMSFAGSAMAADLPAQTYSTRAPVYTPSQAIYNWTGFYVGGHIGGAFAGGNSLEGTDGRFLGGVQGGFDYQLGSNWVIGAEAQFSWLANGRSRVRFPDGGIITSKNDEIGSATARIGYTWGPALLYAKGGFAWRDNPDIGVSLDGMPVAFAAEGVHRSGWTVGAGLEYMFAPNWSAKVEYQYYNFGDTTFTSGPAALTGTRARDDDHTVKAGVSYRFGWGGPVQPRY